MTPNAAVCIPDARLRSLFSLLLTDIGASVASCQDAEDALRVLGARDCQIFVLVQGAVADTGEFLAKARELAPQTKFLLIANRDEIDEVLPLFSQGVSDALLQPINPKRAVAALQKLVGGPRGANGVPNVIARDGTSPADTAYRPCHLVARSDAMRKLVADLWTARNDPIGVILRGDAGVEFELVAREYQAMGGDLQGGLIVLSSAELDVETLATQVSLDRLNLGLPRTHFVPDIDHLRKDQEKPLLEFLRRARRQREREKPLRIVFAAQSRAATGGGEDEAFLEELQFIVPAVVNVPSLIERRADIEWIVRRVLTELTAIFPEYRVRSIHPAAIQWLVARSWRGNYNELVSVVRQAVADCPNRELTTVHLGKLIEVITPDREEMAAARLLAAMERLTSRSSKND